VFLIKELSLKMKVLIIHNHYKNYGGEDAVVEAEKRLLMKHGHQVIYYSRSNAEFDKYNYVKKIGALFNLHWSNQEYLNIQELIKKHSPDIAHIHNTFYLITPSVYFACKDSGVPIVQTMHNYRFLCSNGKLYAKGRICESCLRKSSFNPGIFHGCWKGSRLLTCALAKMLRVHKQRGTFKKLIDCYVALTEFSKSKFVEAGYASDKIVVKPNFISGIPEIKSDKKPGEYALFVGRLSSEKGVSFLINSWGRIRSIPLKIIGNGELFKKLKKYSLKRGMNIEFLGEKNNEEVIKYIKNSAFTIFPSEWYETFGLVIIESFACGIPVIASRIGAMQELVSDKKTGLLFNPGDTHDFVKQVEYLWGNVGLIKQMGENARQEYINKYTEEKNYENLMSIYTKVTQNR
jgi:glycosyltransferase involved in cell wall biosynthesis